MTIFQNFKKRLAILISWNRDQKTNFKIVKSQTTNKAYISQLKSIDIHDLT